MARKSSKAKAEPPVVLNDEEVRGRLLDRIRGQDGPSTLSAILKGQDKALGRARADLVGIVEALHTSGSIHRYGTPKTPKYHHEEPASIVGRSIEAAASGVGAMTWADLKKRPVLKAEAKLVPAKQLDTIRDGLVQAGRIYRWPKTTPKGSDRYSTEPPDSSEYLQPLLAQFREQLKALAERFQSGLVTPDRLERAAGRALLKLGEGAAGPGFEVEGPDPPIDLGRQILDAMRRADPGTSTGAPITFQRLRPGLTGPLADKATFDEAVLQLGRQGLVSLHRHDFPMGQTEEAREQMVPDGRGGYYFTISRRAAP